MALRGVRDRGRDGAGDLARPSAAGRYVFSQPCRAGDGPARSGRPSIRARARAGPASAVKCLARLARDAEQRGNLRGPAQQRDQHAGQDRRPSAAQRHQRGRRQLAAGRIGDGAQHQRMGGRALAATARHMRRFDIDGQRRRSRCQARCLSACVAITVARTEHRRLRSAPVRAISSATRAAGCHCEPAPVFVDDRWTADRQTR